MKLDDKMDRSRQLKYVVLLLCFLVVVAVVVLKKASNKPNLPVDYDAEDSVQVSTSMPDTTTSDIESEAASDYVPVEYQQADSVVQKDRRAPSDAGYEDGYNMGVEDAKIHVYKANYDESSEFVSAADQAAYAMAYRKGYDEGYGAETANPQTDETVVDATAGEIE